MTLPYDIARCQGATVQNPNERGGFPSQALRRGCADCQRRTSPGRPDGPQTMMGPPPFERDHCPERIAPTPTTQPAQNPAGFFTPEP